MERGETGERRNSANLQQGVQPNTGRSIRNRMSWNVTSRDFVGLVGKNAIREHDSRDLQRGRGRPARLTLVFSMRV